MAGQQAKAAANIGAVGTPLTGDPRGCKEWRNYSASTFFDTLLSLIGKREDSLNICVPPHQI